MAGELVSGLVLASRGLAVLSGRARWFSFRAGMAEILAGSRWSQYGPRGLRGGRHGMTWAVMMTSTLTH
jgi:hypothetical protein